jgi:hypothetical protein
MTLAATSCSISSMKIIIICVAFIYAILQFMLYKTFLFIPVLLYLLHQGSLNSVIYFLCSSFDTANNVLWHVDPLLCDDREICDFRAAVARQRTQTTEE